MNKTLLVTSIALTLGITTPSANAAFTTLSAGDYTMSITGGCFSFGDCTRPGTGSGFTDNTASQAVFTVTANTATTRTIGSTIGSGSVGGTNGTINFSIDTSGNMSISSFAQDSYINNCCGNLYIDAAGGTDSMTGSIDSSGNVTFTPAGREGLFSAFSTTWGVQEWNRDNASDGQGSGTFTPFTSGTATNRSEKTIPAFSLTGSALIDDGSGGWTGTIVSAGNVGSSWTFNGTGLDNIQYSEVWDISITAAPAVPVPAAVWLFGSGLLGLIGVARRRKHI